MKTILLFTVLFTMLSAGYAASPAAHLPLRFEQNRGQARDGIQYLAHDGNFSLGLDASGAVISTAQARITIRLENSTATAQLVAEQPLPGRTNYLLGADTKRWITGVPGYGRVRRKQAYPGIDMVYYGNAGRLEYDFVLEPGADPSQIGMRFEGAPGLSIAGNGDLLLDGVVRQKEPLVYQGDGDARRIIKATYLIDAAGIVRFQIAGYDRSRALTIDPVIIFGTYLGSSGDENSFGALAVDALGNTYIAGESVKLQGQTADYPTTPGAYQTINRSGFDAVISKLRPDGSQLVYSTYIGGQGDDAITSIAVQSDGSLFFCGVTGSSDFPVTPGVFQTTYGGSASDAFFGRLSPDGSTLMVSSFLGGTGRDSCKGIVLNLPNRIIVGLKTSSPDLRTSNDAFQPQKNSLDDLYFLGVTPDGVGFVNGTYVGGTGVDEINSMVLDNQNNLIAVGRTDSAIFPTTAGSQLRSGTNDAFVLKLGPTFARIFVRLLSGSGAESAIGVATDLGNNIYVVGDTDSANFPTTSGVYQANPGGRVDAFLTKLGAGGTITFTTLIGGSGEDSAWAVSADVVGNVTVVGETYSTNFPLTDDAFQRISPKEFQNSYRDAFLVRFNPNGALLTNSTLFGGNFSERATAMHVDAAGVATIAGTTESDDFPVTAGSVQTSLGVCRVDLNSGCRRFFLMRLDLTRNPSTIGPRILLNGVVNSADYSRGGLAPGDLVTIYGFGLGPVDLVKLQLANDGTIRKTLAGTRVLFNGIEGAIIYTSANQVSAVAPHKLAGAQSVTVVVEYNEVKSPALILPVRFSKLAIYTADSSGSGQAAARNADFTVNSGTNRVARGSAILLWATGLGVTIPNPPDGAINTGPNYPMSTSKITATIGGKQATVLFAGGAPDLAAGVIQINLAIPADVTSGNAEVVVTMGERPGAYSTQPGVTIAVQ